MPRHCHLVEPDAADSIDLDLHSRVVGKEEADPRSSTGNERVEAGRHAHKRTVTSPRNPDSGRRIVQQEDVNARSARKRFNLVCARNPDGKLTANDRCIKPIR